ncbi:MAG TPA: helix-turn-helix transcriptional regulator, partial [Marinilabiliaceae bacterium]|nr:helix-turn-helix transcriptional regulator [Marinilabiliaceae bacterium]
KRRIDMKQNDTTTWEELKDDVYGKIGTERRDRIERDFKSLRVGLLLREAREKKQMTQGQLGEIIDKKRSYISRVENDSSNMTLKTLYDIVEKGLGGKIRIQIEL